jgi:hypothetical protein
VGGEVKKPKKIGGGGKKSALQRKTKENKEGTLF